MAAAILCYGKTPRQHKGKEAASVAFLSLHLIALTLAVYGGILKHKPYPKAKSSL